MSANNKIIIKELIDGSFVVHDIQIDNGFLVGWVKTLEGAKKLAKKRIREQEVEYGAEIIYQDDYQELV